MNTALTDMYAMQFATAIRRERLRSWGRARWLPMLLLVMLVVMAQEGALEMSSLPDDMQRMMTRLHIPNEYAPLVGVAALIWLLVLGVRVYRRTMQRMAATGLETA